jgi:hypothetical protein
MSAQSYVLTRAMYAVGAMQVPPAWSEAKPAGTSNAAYTNTRYDKKDAVKVQSKAGNTAQVVGMPSNVAPPGKAAAENVSEIWRITGTYQLGGQAYVVLANTLGRIRLEHPSAFQNRGLAMVGEVDGERVMAWSGVPAATGVQPGEKK